MENKVEKILSKYTIEEQEEILKAIKQGVKEKERSNEEVTKILDEVMGIYGLKSIPVEKAKSDVDKQLMPGQKRILNNNPTL